MLARGRNLTSQYGCARYGCAYTYAFDGLGLRLAHAMPPYLGQGANQAVQDAQALALAIAKIGVEDDGLATALQQYEAVRKKRAESILLTSEAIGWVETQGGIIGTALRNNLFRVLGSFGVPGRVFLKSSLPHVD